MGALLGPYRAHLPIDNKFYTFVGPFSHMPYLQGSNTLDGGLTKSMTPLNEEILYMKTQNYQIRIQIV